MGQFHSDTRAALALNWAKITISRSQVQRIARQLGNEMAQQRDNKVAQRRRELPVVVAVEVDGGRLRTRAPESGPGVREVQSKEEKVACLMALQRQSSERDPRPEPPPLFRQPRRARRLVAHMKRVAAADAQGLQENAVEQEDQAAQQSKSVNYRGRPRGLVRACVASMACSDKFGSMMAADAQERGLYQAKRKALVADGASCNWSIHRGYFADFGPITDFLHALCSVYPAAMGPCDNGTAGWSLYEKWLRACWQGRVGKVVEELKVARERVGVVPEGEELDEKDARRLVAEALSYLSNNASRMDYPRCRREGLPITSSLVESLVGISTRG